MCVLFDYWQSIHLIHNNVTHVATFKARRVALLLDARRKNFGGPSSRYSSSHRCTTLLLSNSSEQFVVSYVITRLHLSRLRCSRFVVFVVSSSCVSSALEARPKVHGHETFSGSSQAERNSASVSATLTLASRSWARAYGTSITPVNWPFSHVNQPRFAPSLWPTFAVLATAQGPNVCLLVFSLLFRRETRIEVSSL